MTPTFVTLEECGFASSTPGWKEDFVTRGVQITFWLDEDEEDVYKTAEEALEFARREVELKNVDPASVEAVVVHRV
jgi:pyrimidine deaminase RibD-like protein